MLLEFLSFLHESKCREGKVDRRQECSPCGNNKKSWVGSGAVYKREEEMDTKVNSSVVESA